MLNFEVIIGSYEEFLLGYKVETKNEQLSLVQTFADKSHSGPLKCVAVHKHWIATGSTDDRIFVYDMRTRKQSQILLTHDGTINALAFTPDDSHLFSVGDDGRMIATRSNSWTTVGIWKKAHNGAAVTHISCHPSGKLALTLGSDLILHTWNLVKGRVAYKKNLKSRNTLGFMPDCLTWSTSGAYFSITGQRIVEIWSIKTADVIQSIKTNSKPVCLSWIKGDICLVGLEDGKIMWINVNNKNEEKLIEAYSTRVKAMCHCNGTLITASSAGEIKLWEIEDTKQELKELASVNIGCRPTCLAVLDLNQFSDSYVLTRTVVEIQEEPVKKYQIPKPQPRGIVKIEYENEDDENDLINKTDEKNEIEKEQSDDDDSDKESDSEKSSQDDDDNDDNSDDEIDNELQIRLPKSRKHKQHILNTNLESKKAKLMKEVANKNKPKQNNDKTKNSKQNNFTNKNMEPGKRKQKLKAKNK